MTRGQRLTAMVAGCWFAAVIGTWVGARYGYKLFGVHPDRDCTIQINGPVSIAGGSEANSGIACACWWAR